MLSELGKEKTHYHKRRGLNENVMSRVPYRRLKYYIVDKDFQATKNGFGEVPNVSEPFLTTTILWIFKPSQFYEAYPLTLIPCRKGNWLHVGSTPTASTHSRVATLIVGIMAKPMMEAVSLPPKEAIKECPSYLWWRWS